MAHIIKTPDTEDKLRILSADSQYDLACACGSSKADKRKRSAENTWIYPVALPDRGKTFLFKTLVSNKCSNDCRYCPLRADQDPRRCTLTPEETVRTFFEYRKRKDVSGLFLSSGIMGTPDKTMEHLNTIARKTRKQGFKGYLHLKIIPGASDAAIEDALSLATQVSLNIETPGNEHFRHFSERKNFMRDIIGPIKKISALTAKGQRFEKVKQTTQFVIGASNETDWEVIRYMWGLYDRLKLQRIYFNSYSKGLGDPSLPGEQNPGDNNALLTREHRLYQTDFLMRVYKFKEKDIPIEANGNLSLEHDPKEMFARLNPELYPLNVNRAGYYDILKVPGIGPITARRIMKIRKEGGRIRQLSDIGKPGKVLKKAGPYLRFD